MPIGNTTLPNLAQRNRLVGISSAGLIISGSVIISGSANTITLSGASTTQTPATQTFVTTQVSNLVDAAPAALDTLNELAAAIGDDANFATTISTALGNRLRVDTASQGLTSTQQGYARTNLGLGTAATTAATAYATAAQGTYADAAYSWGNHALAGYLTSVTNISGYASTLYREDNRTISPAELTAGNVKFGFTSWANNDSSPYADFLHLRSYTDSSGGSDNLIMFKKSGIGMRIWQQTYGSSTAYSSYVDVWTSGDFSSTNVSNWNTAYGWGNHASAGYTSNTGTVTSISGTGTVAGLTLTGTVTTSGNITLGGTLSTPVSTINDSTTVGRNLVKLTNPSAIRFIRINADNTVDALDAGSFRTAIGAGTSSTSGTVTSVGGTGTVNGISLSGTVTTSGNLTLGGTLSGIGNSQLTNSSITIAGTATSLGGSISRATILAGSGVISGSAQVNGASITNNGIIIGSTSITLGSSATTISGLTSVNSTNFAASNAFYLNGTNTFLNYTNGRVYSNSGFETAVNVVAPIYYDANDTGYYVDPASTSNIVNVSADRYYQKGNGIPSNNLGDPTVTEMALFDSQFNNKTAFYNTSLLKFYTSTNGSTWTEYTSFSTADKKAFLGGDGTSGVNIPYNTPYFAIEISATGYVFLNALYMYWSSNGHSSTVKTQIRRVDNATWYDHTTSNASVSSWPGHLYLPFGGVPFLEGPSTSTGHFDKIRFIFQPSWNGSFSSNVINLYTFQIWGGYPAGKRNVYYTDSDANVTFPGDLRASVFYDSADTTYYTDPASTSDAALRIKGGGLFGPNASWGKYLMVGGNGRQNYTNNADVASVATTDGNLHIDAASGKSLYLNYYDGGSIEIGGGANNVVSSINTDGSFRPQIIYDYNNTGYYVDPTGTTSLNIVGQITTARTSGTLISSAGDDTIGINTSTGLGAYIKGTGSTYIYGGGKFYDGSTTRTLWHSGDFTSTNVSNWNTAYGWGNHASAGYLTSVTNISGNAGTVTGLTITLAGNPANPDTVTQNQIGYNNSVSLFGQTDGGLYSSAYSSSWIHQIFGDFRTGQIAIRGKNSGTWQSWRTVLDSTNFSTWAAAASHTHTFDSLTSKSSGTGTYTTSGDFRAPIFYDSDNTSFYINPGSTTFLNVLTLDNKISVGTFANSTTNTGAAWIGRASDRVAGTLTVQLGTSTGRKFEVVDYAWTTVAFSADDAGVATAAGSFRAPIFYDTGNTGYYVDPASTSNVNSFYGNEIYANNWFRNVGSNEGLYNETTTQHWSSQTNGLWDASSTTNATTGQTGIRLYAGGHVNTLRGYLYSDGDGFGLLNNQGGWSVRANQGTGYGGQLYGSWQAPILYDSADTGYYVDPASTSVLNNISTWGVSARAGAGVGFGFWDGYGGSSYSIWMSTSNHGTYGGQVSGVGSNNDYNMYFKMQYANRGFVFITGDNTPKVQIANEGLHVAGNIYASALIDRENTGYQIDPTGTSVIDSLDHVTRSFRLRSDYAVGGDYDHLDNTDYAHKGGVTSNTSYTNITTDWAGELYFNGTVLNECRAGEAFDAGHLVYLRDNGKWMKTDAIGASTSTTLLGIAIKASSGDGAPISILLEGIINTGYHADNYSATTGKPLYIATSNIDAPGYITQSAPTSAGEVVRIIGHNIVDNGSGRVTIRFNPDNTWIEL